MWLQNDQEKKKSLWFFKKVFPNLSGKVLIESILKIRDCVTKGHVIQGS